ncbi:MAG TPA: SCO family protein [Verrucomicrobiae bacterium]|nr:SCO family protein [Verrucomicrobiae bacterium]
MMLVFSAFQLSAQTLTDDQLSNIGFHQNLNTQITLNSTFRDENGKTVQLGDYFGRKPVVLVLGYYGCPMLCTLTLNGMVESLEDLKWNIGDQFDVLNVSIDPHEAPALALAKKKTYLKRYGRHGADAGWHFLTGNEAQIKRLADEVGFQYAYDPQSKEFAHASGLVILTPDGKISHYLFGVTFASQDFFTALQDASKKKVGSPIRELILLCFHYNPITGKYGALIMAIVRGLAVATVLGLVWLVFRMSRGRKSGLPVAAEPSAKELEQTR